MLFFYFVLKNISASLVRSIPFYITGFPFFVYLSFHVVLLLGVLEAKENLDIVEVSLHRIVENSGFEYVPDQRKKMLDEIVSQNPVLDLFVNDVDLSNHSPQELPEVVTSELKSKANWYIARRIMWIILGIVIACIIVLLGEDRRKENTHSRSQNFHRRKETVNRRSGSRIRRR